MARSHIQPTKQGNRKSHGVGQNLKKKKKNKQTDDNIYNVGATWMLHCPCKNCQKKFSSVFHTMRRGSMLIKKWFYLWLFYYHVFIIHAFCLLFMNDVTEIQNSYKNITRC